jgi:hypothetical protein
MLALDTLGLNYNDNLRSQNVRGGFRVASVVFNLIAARDEEILL